MKPTGRFNKFTGQEIMEIEESDFNWRNVEFDGLSLDEKADFLSLAKIPFLNKENRKQVIELYNQYRNKNILKS